MRKIALAAAAVSALTALSTSSASATYYGYGYGYRHYAPRVICSVVPVTVYGYYGYVTRYKRVCKTVY
jgi:hypothetical protein